MPEGGAPVRGLGGRFASSRRDAAAGVRSRGLAVGGRSTAAAAGKMPVAVMAESAFSFKKLLDQCENQELEVSPQGGPG